MCLKLKLHGVNPSDLSLNEVKFRQTRAGSVFSPWEEAIPTLFSMTKAVATVIDAGRDENLGELDTGRPQIPLSNSALNYISSQITNPHPCHAPASGATNATTIRRSLQSKVQRRAAEHIKSDALLLHRHPRRFRKPAAPPIKAKFHLRKLHIASTGFIGLRDAGTPPEELDLKAEEKGISPSFHLEDFFGPTPQFPGFTYVKASGSQDRPLVDSNGKVFGIHGGVPDDPGFMKDVHDKAAQAMEAARALASLSAERTTHRRGNFAALTTGISYGGGQTQPGAFVNGVINTAVLCALVNNSAFVRLAGLATGLFAHWAPDVFDFYVNYTAAFFKKYTMLRRPFINSIWCACTFNLGPYTCALGHRDFANLAFGWCAITALGFFDYTKGGHLVLWDCKLVLEFPPGSTILIPSAAIFHSNIPISAGESRYSFTQYTAGGIFRWVEHGFRTEDEYLATLSKEELKEEQELGLERAVIGAGLFSTLKELKSMAAL